MSGLPDISINDWINYNPNRGVLGLHHFGLPGTGKSNFQSGLFQICLKRKEQEFLIMPGDRFCEWKHFPVHPKFPTKLNILVPKKADIQYINFKKNGWFVDVNYDDLDIFHYLKPSHRMLVIYDQHLPMGQRVELWNEIFSQLLNRSEYLERSIGLFFHEAGIYFDEFSEGEQWKQIKLFSEKFVEHRKALVRLVFLSQLQSEVKSTLRKKCPFQIVRKSWLGKTYPKALRKAAPFTHIHQYHFLFGGIYIKNNTTSKFKENKKKFRMIPPRVSLNDKGGLDVVGVDEKKPKKGDKICICGYFWTPRVAKPKKCPKCGHRFDYPEENSQNTDNS